jgi:hypothetical protein
MLELLDTTFVLVVFTIVLMNAPKPTISVNAIAMRADTPREIALLVCANASQ